jgi:D-glycero-D-manno-heptose 1,7-bisphosphate phosphatase
VDVPSYSGLRSGVASCLSDGCEKEAQLARRCVFLDRDGVINASVERDGRLVAPTSLADFHIFPDVDAAIRRLRHGGFLVIVVTNQPDVATGLVKRETVEAMHTILRDRLAVDDIQVCYHVDHDDCTCRKPKPGMLLDAARRYDIDLANSYLVGDRWRDILAGDAAGCFTILVTGGDNEFSSTPGIVVNSLSSAAEFILGRERPGARSS